MTGKNLAPDTGREISTLKRRVSDLERMLDRIRRDAAPPPMLLAPFAAIEGFGYSDAGLHTTDGAWRYYRPANTVSAAAADTTGHIVIDALWRFRIEVAGWYQLGTKITFGTDTPDTGLRTIGIDDADTAGLEQNHRLAVQAAVSPAPTFMVGDVVVYAQSGSHWQPLFGDNRGAVSGAECSSFWCRLVSLVNPSIPDVGSV